MGATGAPGSNVKRVPIPVAPAVSNETEKPREPAWSSIPIVAVEPLAGPVVVPSPFFKSP